MIIVTGATGTIGSELLRLLADAGLPVRALSREGAQAGSRDVEWVRADLADRTSLASAFEDGTCLFLLTGNTEDMVRLQKNAIRSAAGAGIPHIVKLSALGASDRSKSVIGLWHYNVERELRASGLQWTLLRPHSFMQNFLDPAIFDRAAGRIHSAAGDGAVPFIDTRDIAAVAARVLAEPAAHAEQTYTLTGSEAVSYGEATRRIGRVLGRSLVHVSETADEAWVRLRSAGRPTWMAAAQIALAEYQRAGGPTAMTTDTVERLTGRRARTIAEFATDHADGLAATS